MEHSWWSRWDHSVLWSAMITVAKAHSAWPEKWLNNLYLSANVQLLLWLPLPVFSRSTFNSDIKSGLKEKRVNFIPIRQKKMQREGFPLCFKIYFPKTGKRCQNIFWYPHRRKWCIRSPPHHMVASYARVRTSSLPYSLLLISFAQWRVIFMQESNCKIVRLFPLILFHVWSQCKVQLFPM